MSLGGEAFPVEPEWDGGGNRAYGFACLLAPASKTWHGFMTEAEWHGMA